MQQQEDARRGEADLSNLFGQKFPSWHTVGKEATAYAHAIPSWGNGIYASPITSLEVFKKRLDVTISAMV